MAYVIVGTDRKGEKVYWKKWTSASSSGRPKWVKKMSLKCLFDNETVAQKTAKGKGSSHFHKSGVSHVSVEEITQLP